MPAKQVSDFGWTAKDGSACLNLVKTAMREDQTSKRGVFALNSRRIFSRFGEDGVAGEERAGGEGEVPGSPVVGVVGVIGLAG